MPSSAGTRTAAIAVEIQSSAMKVTTERIATRSPRALSTVFAIPVIRSETTSGMIVILRPSSQTPPMLSDTATASSRPPSPSRVHPTPSASPATSADNMSQVLAMRPLLLPPRHGRPLGFDAARTEYPIAQSAIPRGSFPPRDRLLQFEGESGTADSTERTSFMYEFDHLIDTIAIFEFNHPNI